MQGDNWNELLKEVISFDSVEEFWGIYVGHLLRLLYVESNIVLE